MQTPLLLVTPVQCMDTANFINVEFRVCYSFLKHSIFSRKARESFVVVWIIEEIRLKTGNTFLRPDFQKLSHFRFIHKDNAKWRGGSSGNLVLLLFTRFSWGCTEIFVYGSGKVYRLQPDILGRCTWQRVKKHFKFGLFTDFQEPVSFKLSDYYGSHS